MPEISKITLPGGGTYDLKDSTARAAIEALEGASYFLGITTTNLTDGSHTSPIVINGQPVSPKNGSITIHGESEFIWCGKNKYPLDVITIEVVSGGHQLNRNTAGASLQVYVHETTTYEPLFLFPEGATTSYAATAYVGRDLDPDWLYFTDSGGNYVKLLNSTTDNCSYVISGSSVYDDCIWAQFGDLSSLGNLAYKDSISYTKDLKTAVSGVNTSKLDTQTVSVVGAISGVTTSKLSTVSCDVVSGVLSGVSANTTKLVKTTVPNVTSAGSASTWSFTMGSGANAETLVISGANGTAATLGTAIDVATGSVNISGTGATVATGVIGSTYQGGVLGAPSGASSTVTLATGSVAANASGATVATGADGGGYVLEAPSGQSSGDVTFAKGTVSAGGTGATVATGASGTVSVVGSASTVEAV